MNLLDVILKNLWRHRLRSILTGLGVAVAIGAVVALLGVSASFERSFAAMFQNRRVDLVVVRAGSSRRLTSKLSSDIGDRLLKLRGVEAVAPSLDDVATSEGRGPLGMPLRGWPADSFAFENLAIVDGRLLTAKDRGGILLGKIAAENMKKKAGDMVDVEEHPFRVIGVYETPSAFENGAAILLLPDMQELMDLPETVTEFQIAVRHDLPDRAKAVDELRRKIEDLRDSDGQRLGLTAMTTDQVLKNHAEVRVASAIAWVTSVIAIVIGIVGLLNTMAMSVLDQTQAIGILRALGWHKSRVVRMILGEALVLSLLGTAAGCLGAVALVQLLADLPAAEGILQGGIPLRILGLGFVASLAMALIGGALPAWHGANLPPTEALRYE